MFRIKSSTATAPTISSSTRSKFNRDGDIKWQDLLNHFRAVQAKHEKARRQALGEDDALASEFPNSTGLGDPSSSSNTSRSSTSQQRPGMRRQVTSARDTAAQQQSSLMTSPRGSGALSPLNPRSRTQASGGVSGGGASGSGQQRGQILNDTKQQAKRVLSLGNGKK
jgi:vacuole morphology and inheritance protein 14